MAAIAVDSYRGCSDIGRPDAFVRVAVFFWSVLFCGLKSENISQKKLRKNHHSDTIGKKCKTVMNFRQNLQNIATFLENIAKVQESLANIVLKF